jgi:hypothetical protein
MRCNAGRLRKRKEDGMRGVLILGARAPVALELARRFSRDGWKVVVADSIPCRITGWSRAVDAVESIAPPRDNPHQFASDIAQICSRYGLELVVPTCEEIFFLARYRHRIPEHVRVLCDTFDTLRDVHSKWSFVALAQGYGAVVPDSALVDTLEEARKWAQGNAVVIKPEYSRFGVHVRLYPDGIPDGAAPLAALGKWVVQRFVRGSESCSYSVAERGRLLAHSAYRPAWRVNLSSSYYFEPIRNDTIRAFVERFVRKLNFTGQISFDWVMHDDGRVSVLECNPRATSGCHLFDADAPVASALDGTLTECIEPEHAAPRMIKAVMLSAGLVDAVRHRQLRRWSQDLHRATDVIRIPGDGRSLGGALLDLGSYARLALAKRCTMREAATRDIEWDGEPLPE